MNKRLLLVLMSLSLSAQAGTLLPAGSQDASPRLLQSAPAPAGEFERKALSYAWALDPMAGVETQAPYQAESREFWTLVDASEMKRGVAIDTSAPGAVVRVSPALGTAKVSPDDLRVLRNGKLIPEPQGFQRKATTEQLQQAGMDVPDGSAVVQLADAHGQGRFQLQLAKASGQYLVHVFEPNSTLVLRAQSSRSQLLAGDTLEVAALMQDGQAKLGGGRIGGELVSPSGRSYPLAFVDGKARLQVPLDAGGEPGLWEVQLSGGALAKGGSVQRDARTAVAISRPTARFGGSYAFDAKGLRFDLPVQVAAPGRYEVRGTLFATGSDGVSRPVAQAHAAQWFAAGKRQLALAFGPGNVPTGFGAPYELRFLELKDQTRMGTLDTRELAAREAGARSAPAPRAPAPVAPVRGGRVSQR
ncbi:DUF4785 domain-containing protein [Arenimonas sp. MALMAid1274]|uniref:DUF4785 domain-containing protein n=1 Tax=Arenimonas sp. MALMAid1274 TaxID=3411630 RepID=UPI003BA21DAE